MRSGKSCQIVVVVSVVALERIDATVSCQMRIVASLSRR